MKFPINSIRRKKNTVCVELQFLIGKEGDYYVSYCPALDLSSFGDTEEESKKAFLESLDLFLDETIRRGTLEKCLLKLGWRLQQVPSPKYIPPKNFIKKRFPIRNITRTYKEPVCLPVS
jgi:predicted RNase H-like HicB family nuclease